MTTLTTALFLSTIVTRTRRHTELPKKTDKPDGKPVLCQRIFSSVFRAVFFTQTAQFNLECMEPFRLCEETVNIVWYESCEKYKWAV
jgi:hypothetical protein